MGSSPYGWTVFIRRTDDFRFEVSLSVHEKSANPSLGPYFLSFVSWAAQVGQYTAAREGLFTIEGMAIWLFL